MSTVAKPGIGAVLRRWNTTETTGGWETIAEVTKLSWAGSSRNVIETFQLDNADNYVNKLQGVLNAGTITATINYVKDQFNELKTDLETRGSIFYQIQLPDGEGLEWEGFISEFPLDVGSDDAMKSEITWEIDGKPDFLSTVTVGTPT